MRLKTTTVLLATAAAGGVFLINGGATAADVDSATGGGQVNIGSRGGAGDTIAFTARDTGTDNEGQVQYVDRSADGQTVLHGTVDCVRVSGTEAWISGTWNDGAAGRFGLYVHDNGEGAAADDDVIAIVPGAPDCDFDQSNDMTALARGNARVYDAP